MPPRDRTRRRVVPRQARAQASIDAILTAAELLLCEEGFARMTTNRIARRAGVNVALVYRYFAGKEAIVGALIERTAIATRDQVRAALAENATAPLRDAVRALLVALIDTPSNAAVHRELVEHVGVTKRREQVDALRAEVSALFTQFLASRRTELRPFADERATLFILQHAIDATTHAAAFYRPDGLSIERVLAALTDLVASTLLPPEA